jgi:hypothetical protein
MNKSTTKLDMVLARAGEIVWYPPSFSKKAEPKKPIILELNIIEKMVGFTHKISSNENFKMVSSAWIDKFETYYGEFSEGISVKYQNINQNERFFTVEQHRIINSNEPEMFIYQPSIIAYQKEVGDGLATIVLPPSKLSISFAEIVIQHTLMKVLFSWEIDKITAEEIIDSLV